MPRGVEFHLQPWKKTMHWASLGSNINKPSHMRQTKVVDLDNHLAARGDVETQKNTSWRRNKMEQDPLGIKEIEGDNSDNMAMAHQINS